MKLVAHGVSRQEAHEQIRILSRQAIETVKTQGGQNDLIERIKKSDFFVSFLTDCHHISETILIHYILGANLARIRWHARRKTVHWSFGRDCGAVRWPRRTSRQAPREVPGVRSLNLER